MAPNKVVLCGAGFLGKHIARAIASNSSIPRHVQISSRSPTRLLAALHADASLPADRLSAAPIDITQPSTLGPAFEGAHTVVSLVGILNGTPEQFLKMQCLGAENVAAAAKEAGARLIHFSAIGADPTSDLMYAKTKGRGEELVRTVCPDATIIRPSLVFGPEDDFFNRFAKLSKWLPFLPVFNGGTSKFQPVYVGDIARAVELITRGDPAIEREVAGKTIEAGGPDVHTFAELMEYVLKYIPRWRPIVSLPLPLGMIQAGISERLPTNMFTITRDQIKQLQLDNVVTANPPPGHIPFDKFLETHTGQPPTSLHTIVPQYLHLN